MHDAEDEKTSRQPGVVWIRRQLSVHFADKITEKTKEIGSPLCLGLDPHQNLIPDLFKKKSSQLNLANIEDFLFEIIKLAKGRVAAFKTQVAFFEEWGPEGFSLFSKI